MEVLIGILLLVGGIAVVYGHSVIARRHTVEAWKAAAERFHLQFELGDNLDGQKIWGEVKGHAVRIHTIKQGNSSMMRLRVDYLQPIGIGLRITSEGFFSGFSKMLGEQDIEVGSEPFDQMALIKGSDEAWVRQFLNKERRRDISQALREIPNISIEDDHVHLVCAVKSSASEIISLLVQMLSVAACMSEKPGEPLPETEPTSIEDLSGFEQIPPPVPEEPEQELPSLPVEPEEEPFELAEVLEEEPVELAEMPEVEPEDLVEDGPAEESVETEEAPGGHQELPTEPAEQSEEPEENQAPQPAEPVEKPADSTPAGPIPAEVCRELFASGISSISVDSVFDQRFRGRQVCWQGLLRSFSRYSYDPALGEGPALKVHLDLMEIEADYGSRRMVETVIQMPLSYEAVLAGRAGDTLTFTGELHRADGLMFRIFLISGEVILPDRDHAAP
jgi:hypothetical protein